MISLCIYHVIEGKEDQFRTLLDIHWPTMRDAGLASEEPSKCYRGKESKDAGSGPVFYEFFEWSDPEGPRRAHELPEVMAVWEPMGALCEARDGRPAMEFPQIEPLAMSYER